MANNAGVATGADITVATDDVAGVHHPVVKLAVGVEDSAVRIGHLEDAAHSSGAGGFMVFAVRKDTATALADADGDYIPLIVDASGRLWVHTATIDAVVPGTGATNLGKAEDAAHTTGDTGVMFLAVRNDAGGAIAGTTGDYIPLTTDANGALRVTGGGGGTQYVEDVAHASGDTGTMLLAVRNDAGTALAGTTGDYIPISTDANGYLYVNLAAGTLNLGAGEAHLGEVGGNTAIISPSLTITAGAYSANDVVGGEITLTNAARVSGGSGVITDIVVLDDDNEKAALTIVLYDSDPAANTADNGAFAWGSGDLARCIGKVNVAGADYETMGGNAVAHKTGLGIGFKASGSANLYMYLIATGTPTYAATSDLQVKVKVLRD